MKEIESMSSEHSKEDETKNSKTTQEQKSENIRPTRNRLEGWKNAIENQRIHTENAEAFAQNPEGHPNSAQFTEETIANQRDYAKRQRDILNKMEANIAEAQKDWEKRLDQLPPNVYVEYMGALNNFNAIQAEETSGKTSNNNESNDLRRKSMIAESKLHKIEQEHNLLE